MSHEHAAYSEKPPTSKDRENAQKLEYDLTSLFLAELHGESTTGYTFDLNKRLNQIPSDRRNVVHDLLITSIHENASSPIESVIGVQNLLHETEKMFRTSKA